jgi:hypothetical protein
MIGSLTALSAQAELAILLREITTIIVLGLIVAASFTAILH